MDPYTGTEFSSPNTKLIESLLTVECKSQNMPKLSSIKDVTYRAKIYKCQMCNNQADLEIYFDQTTDKAKTVMYCVCCSKGLLRSMSNK
jgi:predicted SprT family Zn-dependent metalloprotease